MTNIINGKEIAAQMRLEIAKQVLELKNKLNILPALAVILVGEDSASQVYVRNKEKAAHEVGMKSLLLKLPAEISEEALIKKIEELNEDKDVHGILVQLPLPKHIDSNKIIRTINYHKDVDGFHVVNVGKLSTGDLSKDHGAIVPCTPKGCLHLLKTVKEDLAGLKALVIGASNIVGRPLARLLMLEKCTVTIANSSTKDLKSECLASDIILSATGVANLVKADMVKEGAIIIDIGINRVEIDGESKLVGDVDFEGVKDKALAITPVPGGVGPMTIAYLLKNTLDCCLRNINKN